MQAAATETAQGTTTARMPTPMRTSGEPPSGLTTDEAFRALQSAGPNALPETAATPLWRRFLGQFRSPLIYLLLFALVFDLGSWLYEGAHTTPLEAIAIAFVLLLNATLGTVQEFRSERALAQLKALGAPLAWVLRDGKLVHIASRDIVPGDVVRVEAGERIAVDGVFVDAHGVSTDEAVLTGESLPVDKEQQDEAFSGTLMVRGKGLLRVTRTGPSSTMGKLATMLGSIRLERTPLERRLDVLGTQIAKWVAGIAVLITVLGLAAEGLSQLGEIVLFATALAVAAVPEGMPAVVTLALSRGVQRMAKRKAIIRRMSAVEALGSVTVIATDKTGTLTENKMEVRALESERPAELLEAMVLANDADALSRAGDPLELGLLDHAVAQGVDVGALRNARPRVSLRPFDSRWKYMRVSVSVSALDATPTPTTRSYLKGAAEVIIARCHLTEQQRAHWIERAECGANEGFKVLGFAVGSDEQEEGLQLLGLALLWDPPRAEVPDAIAVAQAAGVRVVMITGDHPGTARAVARAVGIHGTEALTGADIDAMSADELRNAVRTASVFARVSPEHKLRLVEVLQEGGDIVAMTGDGVNDAPALKRADVGVAMGQRGSDVAREVADLVLMDDNFATIVGAIDEGRGIYENIQKFIRFLFSTNIALVTLVVLGAVGAYILDLRESSGMLLLPLTAIQLLWINFLGDGPPALALALDHNTSLMTRPPRDPQSPLLDRASLRFVLITGLVKAGAGLALLVVLPLIGYGVAAVRTAVFLFESVAQLVFAYPSRRLSNSTLRNPSLHVVILLAVGLQVLALTLPPLRTLLGLTALDARAWLITGATVIVTWLFAELINVVAQRGSHRQAGPAAANGTAARVLGHARSLGRAR